MGKTFENFSNCKKTYWFGFVGGGDNFGIFNLIPALLLQFDDSVLHKDKEILKTRVYRTVSKD